MNRNIPHVHEEGESSWKDWSAASSIDEMSKLVIGWLQGRTPVLPWHSGPPDEETNLIRSQFIAVNQVSGIMTDNSQPGLETVYNLQRAFLSGFATPTKLAELTRLAETTTELGPDDPIVTQPQTGSNNFVTYARATPVDQLFLPKRTARILSSVSRPFVLYDPVWKSNRMWRLLDESLSHGKDS